jgi:thimet oligopeptidase
MSASAIPFGVPTITPIDLPFTLSGPELRLRASEAISGAENQLEALLSSGTAPSLAGFLEPLNVLLTRVHDVADHGSLIFAVHPDGDTRSVGRQISESADRFFNTYRLNEGVYTRLQGIDLSGEDTATRFAITKMLREMRRAGVEKDPATRARLLELSNTIDSVSNQFSENIATLDRAIEVDGTAELHGLPPDYLETHRPNSEGGIRITTNYADFLPVMAYAESGDVRRRLLLEFMNRAYPENMPILDRLLALRGEFAHSLGYSSYADYALEDKMMGNPTAARTFLERVGRLLSVPAEADLQRYLGRKQRDHPEATALELWDSEFFGRGFYDGKLRTEEFGVDTKVLRSYLPYLRVRDGLFELCHELFGISFVRVASTEIWHPTVEAYDVTRDGAPLGRCYLDLVPRPGKFSHAACFGVRTGIAGLQLPQSALVCNFLDPNGPPESALMEWSEVITFFHEFGHLIHALLAGHTRWLFNGQSYVEWDFIEAPSQLFEEWARDPRTLSNFARNPTTFEDSKRPSRSDALRECCAKSRWRPSRWNSTIETRREWTHRPPFGPRTTTTTHVRYVRSTTFRQRSGT